MRHDSNTGITFSGPIGMMPKHWAKRRGASSPEEIVEHLLAGFAPVNATRGYGRITKALAEMRLHSAMMGARQRG